MNDQPLTIPFSTVLASTVHDMKNALSLILNSLDEITEKINQVDPDNQKISLLRYEASRVNGLLMQLLALYKAEQKQLPLNINFHNLYDFLEEQSLSHDDLIQSKGIEIIIDADEELEWAFDYELMATVVSNIITNNIRYTKSTIGLKATIINDKCELQISDNGTGYPDIMLDNQNDVIMGINQSTGSTGLGLYFAGQVANMHHREGVRGEIHLSNAKDSGGIFTILIP